MNASRFYDGVYAEANRTNEASGRSWHVPEASRVTFRQSFGGSILIGLAGVMVFCGLIWTLAAAFS